MKKIIPLISISLLVSVFSVGVVASLNEINNTHEANALYNADIYTLQEKSTLDNMTNLSGTYVTGSMGFTNKSWSANITDLNTNAQYVSINCVFEVVDSQATPINYKLLTITLWDDLETPINALTLYNRSNNTYLSHTFEITQINVYQQSEGLQQPFDVEDFMYSYGGYNKSYEFEFYEQINYYFPQKANIDDIYANTSYLTELNSGSNLFYYYDLLNNTFFYSGGQLFNKIRLMYVNAQATSFVDDSGNRQVFQSDEYVYFHEVWYENTITGKIEIVNTRNRSMWTDGSSVGYNIVRGSTWESNDYRYLTIITKNELQEASRNALANSLSRMNNAYNVSNGLYISNNALGGVFDLLKSAFASLMPFANIMIIPGISLGMLILLPFIVTLIIVLIRLVKK